MDHSFYLQLVNQSHPVMKIPDTFLLAPPHPDYPDILMEARAATALYSLLTRLNAFDKIIPVSGFRSRKEQQEIWDNSIRKNGLLFTRQYVAIPGCSEHETGLAIDLAAQASDIDFIRPEFPYTGIYGEFRRMAPSYGFILRYPSGKEHITHISSEPWHFRYVGVPYASFIADHGLVLEEFSDSNTRSVS